MYLRLRSRTFQLHALSPLLPSDVALTNRFGPQRYPFQCQPP